MFSQLFFLKKKTKTKKRKLIKPLFQTYKQEKPKSQDEQGKKEDPSKKKKKT